MISPQSSKFPRLFDSRAPPAGGREIQPYRLASLALVFVGLAILGGQLGLLDMPALYERPTAPRGIAGIAFLLASIALFFHEDARARPHWMRALGLAAGLALLALSLGNLILRAYPALAELLDVSGPLMNTVSTAGFIVLGAWLTAACLGPTPAGITWAGLALIAVGGFSLLAHCYGVPLEFFGFASLGALTSAGFVLGGIGLCTVPQTVEFPLRLFCEDTVQSLLLRTYLPPLLWLLIAFDLGNYVIRHYTAFNPALRDIAATLAVTGIMAVVVTRIARRLGSRLDQAQNERRRAEDALRNHNQRLEEAVVERTKALSDAFFQVEQVVGKLQERERQLIEVSGREQQRLGQELHDQVGQLLTGIGFLSRGIETQLEQNQPIDAEAIISLRKMTVQAVEQARTLARTYTPLHLQSHGLDFLLEEFCQSTGKTYSVDCQFSSQSDLPDLSPGDQLHLYRIVQEAVINAVKHGNAPTIQVKRLTTEDGMDLVVTNNGQPPTTSKKGPGLGLAIMRYRADAIGATLSVDPNQSSGFEVRCHLPLPVAYAKTNPID